MNIKKLSLALTALLLCLSLAACGSSPYGSYKSESSEMAYEPESYGSSYDGFSYDNAMASGEAMYAANKGSSLPRAEGEEGSAYDPANVKLIYRASLEIQATDFDETVSSIERLVSEHGGYFESSNVYNGSYYSDMTYKRGSYTVRIPSEKYADFLSAVGTSCYISNKSESVEDIGLQYADTEAMLETLRIKQARLQELLAEASGLSDIIQLENALSDTEYQINRYSSTKNRYDSLIGYATVNINVEKVTRVVDGIDRDESFFSRLGRSFTSGIHDFADNVGDFVIGLAYNIIPLAIAALVLALLFRKGFFGGIAEWFRERNQRSRMRKAEKKAAKAAKNAGKAGNAAPAKGEGEASEKAENGAASEANDGSAETGKDAK